MIQQGYLQFLIIQQLKVILLLLCEGFIINDIDIQTYQSTTSKNHFLHNIVFAAVNTTRYNTVSFKTTVYQDSTPMMNNWNKAISEVENSKDLTKNLTNAKSNIYIAFIFILICMNRYQKQIITS